MVPCWPAAVEPVVAPSEFEMWFRYTQNAQPTNDAEAEAFERFRRGEERAWARSRIEREAWERYMDGEEPAGDQQVYWFGIFREAGSAPDAHWKEKRAFERYSDGEPPRCPWPWKSIRRWPC